MNLKTKLVNKLLAHLLVAPDPDNILSFDYHNVGGRMVVASVKIGGDEITSQLAQSLKEEARTLKRMYLWQVINASLAEQARQVMFNKSQSWEDMKTGKDILYTTNMQQKWVEGLEKL